MKPKEQKTGVHTYRSTLTDKWYVELILDPDCPGVLIDGPFDEEPTLRSLNIYKETYNL